MVSTTIIGVIGLAYYLLYPQIKFGVVREPMIQTTTNHSISNAVTPYKSVIKTLTDDEYNVINVLNAHNDKYLQKYIRKETGLSRLKTHRIISRLAQREIVSIEKTGNTNQVYLANWLNNKTSDSK
jgi:predicted transcriptional regulator